MDDARSVFGRNIVRVEHAEGSFRPVLVDRKTCKIGEERLIARTDEVRTLAAVQKLVVLFVLVVGGKAGGSKDIAVTACLVADLHVVDVRSHTQALVARKGPRRRRPGEEIGPAVRHVRVVDCGRGLRYLKADRDCRILPLLIALGKLVGGKDSRTAGAVRQDVLALVDEPLVPEGLCNPPD